MIWNLEKLKNFWKKFFLLIFQNLKIKFRITNYHKNQGLSEKKIFKLSILNSDSLGDKILIESLLSHIFSESRLLESSERSSHISLLISVHKDSSSMESLGDTQRFRGVTGEDAGGKSEFCVIGSAEHVFDVTENGSIDWLLIDY